jgi:DNA-binding CsgD family transcriptional regulator
MVRGTKAVKGGALLDPRDARHVEVTARALALLPAGAPIASVFDAIRPCVPLAAGIFGIIRPSAPDSMVMHAAWLPPDVFDRWLATPRDQLAQTLAPLVGAGPGGLWRDSETVTGALREQLDVLRARDTAGLGEGIGYKILERESALYGAEHFMLAMLMPRAERLPHGAQAILAALNPSIAATVLRLRLPLTARQPLFEQFMEERAIGYVCLSRSRSFLEANQRAHDLLVRYRAAGVTGGRGAVADFAARAWERAAGRHSLQLWADDDASILDLSAHVMAKESHGLAEDVLLLAMSEVPLPRSRGDERLERSTLTPREKEIALLLARGSAANKQIAADLGISPKTVTTNIDRIYEKLGVNSRPELTKLLR